MVNKHVERCSASLDIKKIQIRTIMKYLFMPIRMAMIEETDNNKCW